MSSLALAAPKTLSSSPTTPTLSTLCRLKVPTFTRLRLRLLSSLHSERGVEFETGGTFFREESRIGRDLGVLSASLYKQAHSHLRVLDAMCGCGVRSCRYLAQSGADFVQANDANVETREVIVGNLKRVCEDGGFEGGDHFPGRWLVSHGDANRVFSECYLKRDFFDLIDIDSFGSDSMFLRSAMLSLKLGGLLYLTNTDGFSSGGHRPDHSLAAYGAYVRPMPFPNEIGLRMLIGGAVREASVLGYHVTPLFSYYSYHGPVFRVMMRLQRGKLPESRHYGFIGCCNLCGDSRSFMWDKLGKISCSCSIKTEVSSSIAVSGPLWTGPLHSAAYVTEMLELSEQWGWTGDATVTDQGKKTDLEKVLNLMIDESDPRLPPGYIKLDKLAKRAKTDSPPLRTLMNAIEKEGYATSRSHIISNALKTNCPMAECIQIVKELQGVSVTSSHPSNGELA